jgi:hypothetical protein
VCFFYTTYEPHRLAFFTREMYFLQPLECISLNVTASETIIQNAKQFRAPAQCPKVIRHTSYAHGVWLMKMWTRMTWSNLTMSQLYHCISNSIFYNAYLNRDYRGGWNIDKSEGFYFTVTSRMFTLHWNETFILPSSLKTQDCLKMHMEKS